MKSLALIFFSLVHQINPKYFSVLSYFLLKFPEFPELLIYYYYY